MGNEVSHPFPASGRGDDHQDPSGNVVFRGDENCAMQHLKLADWEKAGIRLHEPIPFNKNQLNNIHFSDYNLYPDRFAEPETGGHPIRRNSLSSDQSSSATATSPGSHPAITKYNFRIRQPSGSESFQDASTLAENVAGANRPRSSSYSSSKLYYFDFSLIPDKDPNCTLDERSGPVDVRGRRRLYSAGDLDEHKKEVVTQKIQPAKLSPPVMKVTDQETIKEEDERPKPPRGNIPPRRRKTSAPPRFCFFDYSMIPDKDPRWTQKPKGDIQVKKE